jgi:RNA polymerase sigma-70 factor (ECF subfamily)
MNPVHANSMDPELPADTDKPVRDREPKAAGEIDNAWICENYPRIHRAAWLMTGDAWEAEDLAQETFVIALDRWEKFEGRSSHATWLYGILIRLHQRRTRSLSRMRRRLAEYVLRSGATQLGSAKTENPQSKLSQQQWRESVWADVAALPSAQSIAVTLRFAEGMSYQQIAETIGCAVGTAKTRVHHGLKRLRNRLDTDICDDRASEVVIDKLNPESDTTPLLHIASRP